MVPSELRERLIPIYYFIHNCDVILQSVFVKFIQKVICFWFIASIKINHQENHSRFFSVKVILHSVFFYESATKLCYLGPPASCDSLTRLPRLLRRILWHVVLPGTPEHGTSRNIPEQPKKPGTPLRKSGTPQKNSKSAKSKRIKIK